MTNRRRCSWWGWGLVLAALAAGPALAQGEVAGKPPTAQTLGETRQLLDWLGVLAVLDQAPAVLAQALAAEAEFRAAKPAQVQGWRRQLAPTLAPARLQERAIRYVAARRQEPSYRRALELLQQPLAKRVRYFELAMTQPGTVGELRTFLAAPGATATRRTLIRELADTAGTDALVAELQTEISERVRQAAGETAAAPGELDDERAERRRHLAQPTENYLLYAYRYLRDDELTEYRQLLEDRDLQWLLEVSRQAATAALRNAD